ncbi:hypothetical protein HPP92_006807 [Vanilla planifolia]|uniref:BZIP domain-containing protein n=1 Tax=Vanilla planifolia TaxID=51239 RepID=A0A835RF50_VANPL|nr:hypothetical protein HPP92_006807 [Vanilla planifolia]
MVSTSEGKKTVEEGEVSSERLAEEEGEPASLSQEMKVSFPLTRQPSIYSLTLDEVQNTVCEPGKGFGSMNMDEFLTNIWSVEEGFDPSGVANSHAAPLNRQGSVSLPSQLCRKTVDEVWAEIHGEHQQAHRPKHHQQGIDRPQQSNGMAAHRQPTFGEMTLEDFLIKAGVVREGAGAGSVPSLQQSHYGRSAAGFDMGHVVGSAYGGEHENGYYAGGGGMQMGMLGSPASPISSDGFCSGEALVERYAAGIEGATGGINGSGGRKRMADGTVEKVVERRQRRMIKNRESAARSRARKQAYTVELEAELNHLKEENARLREEERKERQLRKQMLLEAMAEQARTNVRRSSRSLRKTSSSTF